MGPFSVADLGIFGQLHGLRAALTRPQAEAIAARRRLSAYLDRVDAATAATAATAEALRAAA